MHVWAKIQHRNFDHNSLTEIVNHEIDVGIINAAAQYAFYCIVSDEIVMSMLKPRHPEKVAVAFEFI